jgi:dolichol-phosphate mannosyltransferase
MPKPTGKLWIILPAYNEGEALFALGKEITALLADHPYDVVLVDDGSTDGSIDAVEAGRVFKCLTVLTHPENRGLGKAVETGFEFVLEAARPEDTVIVMDADRTHPAKFIRDLLKPLADGYDVVIASRYQQGARVLGLSALRVLLSLLASWLFRLMVPVPNVRDYTSGFRAYRASVLQQASRHYQNRFITESGFTCMAEILIKLHRLGARFYEIPFTLHYEQKTAPSKLKIPQTIFCTLRFILQLL